MLINTESHNPQVPFCTKSLFREPIHKPPWVKLVSGLHRPWSMRASPLFSASGVFQSWCSRICNWVWYLLQRLFKITTCSNSLRRIPWLPSGTALWKVWSPEQIILWSISSPQTSLFRCVRISKAVWEMSACWGISAVWEAAFGPGVPLYLWIEQEAFSRVAQTVRLPILLKLVV